MARFRAGRNLAGRRLSQVFPLVKAARSRPMTQRLPLSCLPLVMALAACNGDSGGTDSDTAAATTSGTAAASATTSGTMSASSTASESDSGSGSMSASSSSTGSSSTTASTSNSSTTDASTTASTDGTTSTGTSAGSTGTTDATTGTTGMVEPCQPGDMMGMGDVEKSFLWVANSDEGTISKVDTQKVLELARYRSGALGGGYADNPSRTAVSVDGRFVVVNNRSSGRVTAIAANLEDCKDKNNNGMIDTSQNKGDIRPFDQEECIIWSTVLPVKPGDIGAGPRGVTWTPGDWDVDSCSFVNAKVWVGYLANGDASTASMARIDGATGQVEETVKIGSWVQGWANYGPYGAALDKDKNVWFTGLRGEVFRINASQNPITFDRWNPPGNLQFYGMTVDPDGDTWFGGCSGPVSTFNPQSQQFTAVAGTNACYRGLAADKNGSVWVASNGPCGVVQIDHKTNTLIQFHNLTPCSTPVGVSVDDEGFVWVVDENQGAWKIDAVNPNNKTLLPIANDHYTYSDMTGGQLKSVILPQ